MIADPVSHFEEGSALRKTLSVQLLLLSLHLDQLLLIPVVHYLRDQGHPEELFGGITPLAVGCSFAIFGWA